MTILDLITTIIHNGITTRRTITDDPIIADGLIIAYTAPDPNLPPEQGRYTLTIARHKVWPDDDETRIVRGCLPSAWTTHPKHLIYDQTEWAKNQIQLRPGGDLLGAYRIHWRQWPIRHIFSAPAALQPALRAALARR